MTDADSGQPNQHLLLALAGVAFAFQIIPDLFGGYGYFIDELYYMACARRLADGPVIVIGSNRNDLEAVFDDVRQVGIYECDYCMNWRNDMPIYVARQSKLTASEFEEAWEGFKHYE